MRNRLITIILLLIMAITYIVRGVYINSHSLAPKLISYKIGDEVSIDNDYFDNSLEKMNGYSVSVLNNDIISINDFMQMYSSYNNELNADYMYLIKVEFRNIDNDYGTNAGIDLGQYILQESSYINFVDREAFSLINGSDNIKFALRRDSTKELIIPFHIDTFYIDIKKLKNGNPKLVVSLYPNKKTIELKGDK